MPLIRCLTIPFRCLCDVLTDSLPVFIHDSNTALSSGFALLSGHVIPEKCKPVILRDFRAELVHVTQISLR